MNLLILTCDPVEGLDRRIVNQARIFTDHGWKVHIVLSSYGENCQPHELEKNIVVDPFPLKALDPIFDPLFHERPIAEIRDVVAKWFPKDSACYRMARGYYRAMRSAKSWWAGGNVHDGIASYAGLEEERLRTPRSKTAALLNRWIQRQVPFDSPLFRHTRLAWLKVKGVGQTLKCLGSRSGREVSSHAAHTTHVLSEEQEGRPSNELAYPLPSTLSFLKKARFVQANAILACDLPALPAAAQLRLAWQVPLIYDAHELYAEQCCFEPRQRQILECHERMGLHYAKLCFTVSEPIAQVMQEKYQLPTRPDVLYNAPLFNPEELHNDTAGVRRELGLRDTQKYVLYHGNMARGRNLERLVACFPGSASSDIVLVMLGQGALFDDLERAAQQTGGKVMMHPAVPQNELVPWVTGAEAVIIAYPAIDKNNEFALPNKLFDCIELSTPVVANQELACVSKVLRESGIGCTGPMETDGAMKRTLAAGLEWIRNQGDLTAAFEKARRRYGWEAHRRTFCERLHDIGLPGF